jgi:hypothetical protein
LELSPLHVANLFNNGFPLPSRLKKNQKLSFLGALLTILAANLPHKDSIWSIFLSKKSTKSNFERKNVALFNSRIALLQHNFSKQINYICSTIIIQFILSILQLQ